MSQKEVTIVTGTRAEYGLLKPVMEEIRNRDGLSLSVVATGMHLSPQYGHTIDEIREDGFQVDREVHMLVNGDSELSMVESLGLGVGGLGQAFDTLDPDVVLVLGDRDEAFAAGVAAAHLNITVAHVHGGDAMTGATIDDSIRHALTKFAHVHFPVSERSAERISKLGEEKFRITTVGAPGLDAIRDGEYTTEEELYEKYDIPRHERLALVVQHPLTTDPEAAGEQMQATMRALAGFDGHTVVVYPNSDAGSELIIAEIEDVDDEACSTFRSLPRRDFLGMMTIADVMVGNSSSGIIEAPSLDVPVVDIGPRQEGRERAANTISVPHDADAIASAVDTCLTDQEFRQRVEECDNPYDNGGAGDRIADRLDNLTLDEKLRRKRLTH